MKYYEKYIRKENKVSKYFTKILVSIIFLLVSIIYIKLGSDNKKNYENIFLKDSMSFSKFNDWYQKYFGEIIPIPNVSKSTKMVFSEKEDRKMDNYLNGKIIYLDENSNILALSSGIVVYIGDKQGYNNTIIIQGNDGVDIWYGNIESTSLNLYDYVKKDDIIGISKENMYLALMKDNNFISYEEYNKN